MLKTSAPDVNSKNISSGKRFHAPCALKDPFKRIMDRRCARSSSGLPRPAVWYWKHSRRDQGRRRQNLVEGAPSTDPRAGQLSTRCRKGEVDGQWSGRTSFVPMVKTTDLGELHDLAHARRPWAQANQRGYVRVREPSRPALPATQLPVTQQEPEGSQPSEGCGAAS